jgi:hypothetical protein
MSGLCSFVSSKKLHAPPSPVLHLPDFDFVHFHDLAEAGDPVDGGGFRGQVEDCVPRDELFRLCERAVAYSGTT